jgi:hypothetical protein
LPVLVGGDFNIIRRKEEKNNDNFDTRWPFIFNAIIESLDLRELALSSRQFTWANCRDTPTYEKLDRILTNVDWEQKLTLVSVRALTRSGSDHTPLLIDSGDQAFLGNKKKLSFELSWFKIDGFMEMIAQEWASNSTRDNSLENWQNKIHHIGMFLRVWARNLSGNYKIQKKKYLILLTL